MRVMFRFTDTIAVPDGGPDYVNQGAEYLRMRWGLIKEQRIALDTEKVAELDARLSAAPQLAAGAARR
jgi:hypothetical protein